MERMSLACSDASAVGVLRGRPRFLGVGGVSPGGSAGMAGAGASGRAKTGAGGEAGGSEGEEGRAACACVQYFQN